MMAFNFLLLSFLMIQNTYYVKPITATTTLGDDQSDGTALPQLKCNQYHLTILLNAKRTDHCFEYNDTSAICPNLTTALRWQRPLHNVCISLQPDSVHQLSIDDGVFGGGDNVGDSNRLWFKSLTQFSIQSENMSRPAIIQCSGEENGTLSAAGLIFEKSSDIMFKNLHFQNCLGVPVVEPIGNSATTTPTPYTDHDNDDGNHNNLGNSATATPDNVDNLALLVFSKSNKIIFAGVTLDRIKGSSIVLIDSNKINLESVTILNGLGSAIRIVFQNVTKEEDNDDEEFGSGNLITMHHCHFLSNNALSSSVMNAATSSSDNCVRNNQINETIAAAHAFTTRDKGSAIAILLMENVRDNRIQITSSSFENNTAMYGGAVFIAAALLTQNNTLAFDDVKFPGNTAVRSGGSIYVGDFSRIETTNQIIFQNSNFTSNAADPCYGGAVIFSYNSNLLLLGYNRFINNHGTALVLGSTKVEVIENILLEGNSGLYGGAMFLYKCSTIHLSATSNTTFHRNRAKKDGGALFVYHAFKKEHSHCFFTPQNRSAFVGSVYFKDNLAGLYGNHIYTSTLKLCEHLTFDNAAKERIFFEPKKEKSVSTAASDFKINEREWDGLIPGHYSLPHVSITDELEQPIYSPIHIQIANDPWLKDTYVIHENQVTIAIYGQQSTSHEVDFTVDSELGKLSDSIQIKLASCPTQYIWNETKGGKCLCHSEHQASKCSSTNQLYLLPNHWSSPGGNTYSCPDGYCASCVSNKGSGIQRYCLYSWQHPCKENRSQTSRLCSKCAEGLSVSFGSTECLDASESKNFIYIPLIAVVFMLFSLSLMIACNYDMYAGYFTPVILFYQFIPNLLKMKKPSHLIMVIFTVFHSGGHSINNAPFSHNFDDLHKIWIRFVTALMWILLYTMFVFITKCNRFNNFQMAVFRCWPFVFLLFYIDTIKFAMYALRGITIDKTAYLYLYADEEYFGDRHIYLFVAALLLVIFTLLCTGIILCLAVHEKPHIMAYYDDRDHTFDSIISHCKLKWIFGYYAIYVLLFVLMDNQTWELLLVIIFTGFFTFNQPFKATSITEAFLSRYFNFNHFEVLVYLDLMVIGLINQNPDYEDISIDKASGIFNEILSVLPAAGLLVMVGCTLFGILKRRRYSLSNNSRSNIPERIINNRVL